MSIMDHKKLGKVLQFCFKMQTEHQIRAPLFLWGLAGHGKTTGIYEFCDTLKAETNTHVRSTILHLATQDVGDLIGMPVRDEQNKKTTWYMPDWFPTAGEQRDEINVIFLDEFNRAPKYVLAAMLPFLLEGRMHQHIAPDNTFVIAAGNPPSDDYDVTQLFDEALISRLGHLIIEVDHRQWLDRHSYVNQEDQKLAIDECVWEVVNKEPAVLRNGSLDTEALGFKVRPNPRTMHLVGRLTKQMSKGEFADFGYDIIKAFVGQECALMIQKEKNKQLEAIDVQLLLEDFNRVSAQVKKLSDPKNARTDLIQATNNRLIQTLIEQKLGQDKKDLSKEEERKVSNLTMYLLQIPRDQARAMLGMMVAHENKACQTLIMRLSNGTKLADELYEIMERAIIGKTKKKKEKKEQVETANA